MRTISALAIVLISSGIAFCRAAEPDDTTSAPSPQQVEGKALGHLRAGRQHEAEALLGTYFARDPDIPCLVSLIAKKQAEAKKLLDDHGEHCRDMQRLLFLAAACNRSRFDITGSFTLFSAVYAIDPATPAAKCALRVLELDSNEIHACGENRLERAFSRFTKLADANPDDIAIRWMLAVECRNWNRNEEGVRQYKKILRAWDPGPVLVHTTYANLLDALGRYEAALLERHKAVKMEPRAWNYDGLGNTLDHMGRYKEAEEAHAEATRLDPGNSLYWSNWASTLLSAGKYEKALAKCERSTMLNPNNWRAWWIWGDCLAAQGKKAEALKKLEKALAINPESQDVRMRMDVLQAELSTP